MEINSRYYYDFELVPFGIINDFVDWFAMYKNKEYSFIGDFEQNPKPKLKGIADYSVLAKIKAQKKNNDGNSLFIIPDFKQLRNLINEIKNLKYLQATLERHFLNNQRRKSLATEHYLEMINELCIRNGARLYLVNIPVSKIYAERIPKEIIASTDSLARRMEMQYQATYINLSKYPLAEEDFYDFDHITTPGANVVSKVVNDVINVKDSPQLKDK
jgi:hypothetical protein